MKKILALLLALSMIFALVACTGNQGNNETGNETGDARRARSRLRQQRNDDDRSMCDHTAFPVYHVSAVLDRNAAVQQSGGKLCRIDRCGTGKPDGRVFQ